jgi:hypothetical protein
MKERRLKIDFPVKLEYNYLVLLVSRDTKRINQQVIDTHVT